MLIHFTIEIQADKTPTGEVHGAAIIGHINRADEFTLLHDPIGWAKAGDPLTFVHEFGHILGCNHNRELMRGGGTTRISNYGYVMKGSATDGKSGKITIMARLLSG